MVSYIGMVLAPGTGFVWTQGLQPGMHLRDVLGGAEATH